MEKERFTGPWGSATFIVLMIAACLEPLAAAYDSRSEPLYAISLLTWSLIPAAIAWLIFRTGKHAAAICWLVAVTIFGLYVWALVIFWSHGSTDAIAFLWIPVWNSLIVGPMGAAIGVLLSRVIRSRSLRH
jgi:hypothetical protein